MSVTNYYYSLIHWHTPACACVYEDMPSRLIYLLRSIHICYGFIQMNLCMRQSDLGRRRIGVLTGHFSNPCFAGLFLHDAVEINFIKLYYLRDTDSYSQHQHQIVRDDAHSIFFFGPNSHNCRCRLGLPPFR